jgi:site-specific recombinase XerD
VLPHTFRHTFAVMFLRAGGNTFTLQQLLGHTSLAMTNRYVALAQADIENQHRQFSPADHLKKHGENGGHR